MAALPHARRRRRVERVVDRLGLRAPGSVERAEPLLEAALDFATERGGNRVVSFGETQLLGQDPPTTPQA